MSWKLDTDLHLNRSASLLNKPVTHCTRKFRWLVSIRVRDLAGMWEAVFIGISWKGGALRVERHLDFGCSMVQQIAD